MITDEIKNKTTLLNNYFIDERLFQTSDLTNFSLIPNYFSGDFNIEYRINEISMFQYTLQLSREDLSDNSIIFSNNENLFRSSTATENYLFINKLEYTLKASRNTAVQFKSTYSTNNLPQKLQLNLINETQNSFEFQNSKFVKSFFDTRGEILSSINNNKFSYTFGLSIDQDTFKSELTSESLNENLENNFKYKKVHYYNDLVYHLKVGSTLFSPKLGLLVLSQKITDLSSKNSISKQDFMLAPSLRISHKINPISSLSLVGIIKKMPNDEIFQFENPVLIDNRTLLSNKRDLRLQRLGNLSLSYNINDLFNQFQLNISANYQNLKGSFYSNSFINENIISVENIFLNKIRQSFNTNFKVTKFISLLETTFKLKSTLSGSSYYNFVNDSNLRLNKSSSQLYSFIFKTSLDFKANLEGEVTYKQNKTITAEQASFTNDYFETWLKITFKPFKGFLASLTTNFINPNLKLSNEFCFVDMSINYRSQNEKWKFKADLYNLLNEQTFSLINTNDVGTSNFESQLIPRYFSFGISYSF